MSDPWRLHDWNARGGCDACGIGHAWDFNRRDPCPGPKEATVEPIAEWMEETLTKAGLDKKVQVQVGGTKVTFTPTNIDPTWHPEEDTFEVRSEAELYEPPHRPHNPAIRYLGPDDTSEPPKGTPDEVKALHAFMSMAANAEMGVTDNVVLPAHYARFTIEPIRFICENNLNFFQANIVKYILRWDAKNGMEDLQKAKRYLNMFIKFVAKDPDWWKADTQ